MITRYGGQRLRQTITHYHVNTDGMYEFLDVGTDSSTCRGEEMGILKTQFLADQREYGAVQHLVLQMQRHWRLLA